MASEHTATCSITIGGQERTVCVLFTVNHWGSPGSWDEPPEPPDYDITDVRCDDEDGRSIYELCESTRDLWMKPIYADGIFQINHGPPRLRPEWARDLYPTLLEPAYCRIGFSSPWGTMHTLLDSLYEQVGSNHIPELERGFDYDD